MGAKTNAVLNILAAAVLALFLWWAEDNLDGYMIQILNLIAVNIILALSLNLIYGFTGLFSLGHAGFMAIGAYVCSILILAPEQKEMLFILEPAYDWVQSAQAPFFVAVMAGGLTAALFGVLVGIPLLRLGDDYLGMATLGFAEIVRVLAINLPRVTNGALGFKGIPDHANLWWNFGWCLLTLFVVIRLIRSNSGNVFRPSGTTRPPPRPWGSTYSATSCCPSPSARSSPGWAGRCWAAWSPPSIRRCSPSS
jgi:branched-chain amino acid transport system permease protein